MISIAIDGPAGAGKSTIAKKVAAELSYIYVDTGAMFRAMALYLLREGVAAEDSAAISDKCREADITIRHENGAQIVLLNGEDVGGYIRTQEVGEMASKSSVNPDVRQKLLELQRKLAAEENVVMDGRDIGTVVLPDAPVKIYLTASAEVRADRRWKELKQKGQETPYETVLAEIKERDYRDMNREIAPLRPADDAVTVDSSDMTIPEVVEAIMKIVRDKI